MSISRFVAAAPLVQSVNPATLFGGGEYGFYWDYTDQAAVWQNTDGTGAVTAEGQFVGRVDDKSGNGLHAVAIVPDLNSSDTPGDITVQDAKPAWFSTGIRSDLQDDQLSVTLAQTITGSWITATTLGVLVTTVNVTASTWTVWKGRVETGDAPGRYVPPEYMTGPPGDLIGTLMIDRELTYSELQGVIEYFRQQGSAVDFAGVTGDRADGIGETFRSRTELVTFDGRHMNMSNVQGIENFFRSCSGLVTALTGSWKLDSVLEIKNFNRSCVSLVTMDVGNWGLGACTNGQQGMMDLASISRLNVREWDVSNFGTMERFFEDYAGDILDTSQWITTSLSACIATFARMPNVTTLDFRTMTSANVTTCSDMCYLSSSLTTILISPGTFFADSACTNYSRAFEGCALSEQSVNDILVAIEAAGTSSGTLGINGGTNAAPTGAGVTARDALVSRGWTVTTN